MKKKLFCLLLVVALMISCGCGNGNVSEDTGDLAESADAENVADESDQMDQDEVDESENVDGGQEEPSTDEENDGGQENQDAEVTKYHLNDTVSTDIVEFQLNKAEFAFFASSVNDETYATPIDKSAGGIFETHKGHTLVCMLFQITNLDRTRLDVGHLSTDNFDLSFDAIYKDESYNIKSFDPNYIDGDPFDGLKLDTSIVNFNINDALVIRPDTVNVLLDAGVTMTVQTLGQINTEVDDLSDSFEMLIRLPNSSGELEEFIYEIDDGSAQ